MQRHTVFFITVHIASGLCQAASVGELQLTHASGSSSELDINQMLYVQFLSS